MEAEKDVSGISENLSDLIANQNISEVKTTTNLLLSGKQIAISVSESEELEYIGLSEHHLKDISIEIARYLIVNGAGLLYGGDLRNGGYTEIFSDLSYQYKYLNDQQPRFINYFFYPNSKKLETEEIANLLKKQVIVKQLEKPKHLEPLILNEENYDPINKIEDRYLLSECLTDMRKKMSIDSHARIVLGGRQEGFTGYYPGIIEETFHSLSLNKPVYLLGGFGGATKSIIQLISGEQSAQLTNDYQLNTPFLSEFWQYSQENSSIPLNYEAINSFFKNYNISQISEKNGLSEDENKTLFESTNIHELVFLIIKGLRKIKKSL